MPDDISLLWRVHQDDPLPEVPSETKGELWILDEVVGGCISLYLDGTRPLDQKRVDILQDCRSELHQLLPALEGSALAYFSRLETLVEMVLSRQATAGEPPAGRRSPDG
jgi:hypothetical protein